MIPSGKQQCLAAFFVPGGDHTGHGEIVIGMGTKIRRHIRALLLLATAGIMSAGCSPRFTERIRSEYRTVTDWQHDTLWRDRDRTMYVKGDTVRITEKEYIYRTLWKTRADTLFVHDTTTVERVKEVKVEKPLSWRQKAKIGAFWWLVAGLVAALAYIFRRPLALLIKRIL